MTTNVQSLVIYHANKITQAQTKQAESTAHVRNARKIAKTDGVDLAALDYVMGEMKKEPLERRQFLNSIIEYGKALSDPVLSSLDPVDIPDVNEDTVVEMAFGYGLQAGKLGESQSKNPYDIGSPAGQQWIKGWQEGQGILMMAFKETEQKPAETPTETTEGEDKAKKKGRQVH